MGITNTVKNLVSGSSEPTEHPQNASTARGNADPIGESSSAPRKSATTGGQHKLPPGTGPGTSGKPASESAMEYDRERAREQGTIAGYGTDSAAAHGGGLADTHRDPFRPTGAGDTALSSVPGQAVPVTSTREAGTSVDREKLVSRGSDRSSMSSTILDEIHQRGHLTHNARDVMPPEARQEDINQLNPVTHERVRYLETEEVQRVKRVDRHVHHVQHHIQPVIASETLEERLIEFEHPVTNVREIHASKSEESGLLEGQIRQHQDTLTHLDRERTIIDKGVTVEEHVHHHVHHVIQPIIQKETINRQRTRTVIPIHEVTEEAPIVHQSQAHDPVSIERFLQRGGILQNAISPEGIATRVLHQGPCTREVEGVADALSRELSLGDNVREPLTTTTTAQQAHSQPRREDVPIPVVFKQKAHRPQAETETDVPVSMPMA